MFKNYLKTALRNLSRHKLHSVINIAGLVVGFAAFLLIFLVIRYEQSFDDFHPAKGQIYRLVRIGKNAVPNEFRAGVAFPSARAVRAEIAQAKNACSIMGFFNMQVDVTRPDGSVEKKFKEAHVFMAEPNFFEMFDFGLAEGNIATAVKEPNTALLTKTVASKYFGDWHGAVGKTITIFGTPVKITGILNDPPANTDFPLSVVASYATLENRIDRNDWGSLSDYNYCFVQLAHGYTQKAFNKQLVAFVDKHITAVNPNYDLWAEPLKEIHYDSRYGNFNNRTFSKDLIIALSLIGVFLLVIACVNFINLTTAQAINRAREVGVRKVMGSNRSQLIFQFLGETGVISSLALVGALIVAFACIPFLNSLLDIHLSVSILYGLQFLIFLVGILLVVTFLSGFYPALILSGYKSANVLKGSINVDGNKGAFLRKGLVAFQFVIAQVLIIGTLIVASQMHYFRTVDMGFRKDAVINASFPDDSLSRTKLDVLRDELMNTAGVEKLSLSTFSPSSDNGAFSDLRLPTNHSPEADMIVSLKPADTSFFRLYELQLIAGRLYFPSDTMRELVVNETVVKKLGIQDPRLAIGKLVNINDGIYPIVGVVKDFHENSLRDLIRPLVLTSIKDAYQLANIKIRMDKAQDVIAAMKKLWEKHFPDYVFEYKFLDDTIADFYKQENQLSKLYTIFSVLAIFISCLGLYGLISFMAARRKKEIGIRKVLGAPVKDILLLLSREFTILIGIAFLIAAPIAWYFMHQWLQQYTYRIIIGVWFFAATIVGSICIAWLTVGYTAMRAALANPVKSLRTE